MIAVDRAAAAAAKPIKLNCHLAANPYLAPSALLQVDWFKDGRKIADAESPASGAGKHFVIERANRVHLATGTDTRRLFATSSLTIRPPVMSIDSAHYTCQWRLIAHGGGGAGSDGASAQNARAQDSIQLVVSEGEYCTGRRCLASERPVRAGRHCTIATAAADSRCQENLRANECVPVHLRSNAYGSLRTCPPRRTGSL